MTAALRREFDRCWPWLEPALVIHGETDRDGLLALILAGQAQLWPGTSAALITQMVLAPEGPSIHTWLGGGTLAEMLAIRPGLEAWGRSMGAIWSTGEGRKGWERLLAPQGYVRAGTQLRKAL